MAASSKKKKNRKTGAASSSSIQHRRTWSPVKNRLRSWRAFLLSCLLIGLWMYAPAMITTLSRLAGCTLKDVKIYGLQALDIRTLDEAMGLKKNQDLLLLDLSKVQASVSKLPWVSKAIIQRSLPHTLHVHITERQGFAYWDYEGQRYAVAADGTYIPLKGEPKPHWLHLQSACPPPSLKNIHRLQKKFPSLPLKTVRFLRRGRWDLQLQDGCLIKLPLHNKKKAITRYIYLRRHPLLHPKTWISVDLRLPGCAFIRLAPLLDKKVTS